MFALILSLVLLGLIVLVATYFQRKNKTEETEINIVENEECCGAHEVCEQDSLLNIKNEIIYFDDEELDVLANISPADFSPEQIKQLSEVFFTLKESDVAGWLRSLQLRHIQLPIELREEALMIVSERRTGL
jgi:hypothetical protein